jgi:hypothetical protein
LRRRSNHCTTRRTYSNPGPLSREGSLSCHIFCDTIHRFYSLIRRIVPHLITFTTGKEHQRRNLVRIVTVQFHGKSG